MISRLRKRISILISAVSFVVLFLICLILNLTMHFSIESNLKSNINTIYHAIADSKVVVSPSGFTPRFFSAYIEKNIENPSESDVKIDEKQYFSKDDSELKEYVFAAYNEKDDFTRIGLLYSNTFYEDSRYYFVFLDARSEIAAMETTLYVSAAVSVIAFASVSLFGSLFAGKAVSPYEELERKEQTFLTDASHELKTPLAIISANTDVLSISYPNDEYIKSTKSQIKRMSVLINDMVSLFKSREMSSKEKLEEIDLTELLLESCIPFKPNFEAKGVKTSSSIEEGVKVRANGESLAKLFSILTENATKYTLDNGIFTLKLYQDKKNAYIVFYNTCEHFDKKRLPRIFDRFYSLNDSRSRDKSGYGIGLSIAKELVVANNGEIKALSSTGDDLTFFIKLKK